MACFKAQPLCFSVASFEVFISTGDLWSSDVAFSHASASQEYFTQNLGSLKFTLN